MTPLERYEKDLSRADFHADSAQRNAVNHLQRLYDDLLATPANDGWLSVKIARWFSKPAEPVKGLYFWGGVGRGKTYLMDLFHESLDMEQKRRVHFHRFMQGVHNELKQLRQERDPLALIATRWAQSTRILCLDEFFEEDIGDAMILSGLLESLFKQGVSMVTTSNSHPDTLYKNGLQRDRFKPAIELLKTYTEVLELEAGMDYRLQYLDRAEIYHYPLDEMAEENLIACLEHVATGRYEANCELEILGRIIQARYLGDGVVWFDFDEICAGPRSHADYIELAKLFHTVIISGIQKMARDHDNPARRFIELVDEFYDRNVNLIVSAQTPPQKLYHGTRLRGAFERTASRLQEMQSHDYLAREHRP